MCCVHELQVKLETPTPFITSKLNPQLIFRDSPIMMYKTTGRPKGMFSVHYKSYCSLKCLRLMLVNYVCHFCYEVRDINKGSSSNLLSSIVPCKRDAPLLAIRFSPTMLLAIVLCCFSPGIVMFRDLNHLYCTYFIIFYYVYKHTYTSSKFSAYSMATPDQLS